MSWHMAFTTDRQSSLADCMALLFASLHDSLIDCSLASRIVLQVNTGLPRFYLPPVPGGWCNVNIFDDHDDWFLLCLLDQSSVSEIISGHQILKILLILTQSFFSIVFVWSHVSEPFHIWVELLCYPRSSIGRWWTSGLPIPDLYIFIWAPLSC